jgi:hypothetical protein
VHILLLGYRGDDLKLMESLMSSSAWHHGPIKR